MRVAVGMSGGVDSSLSAALLKEAGHDVVGVFLECWRAPGCRSEEDRQDALRVALDLGIPFQVLDFKEAYRIQVVDQFFADYARGLTPNPDIWCNTAIKFGLFYDWAMENGFDAIATGHYARIDTDNEGTKRLLRGTDFKKDQTYFLYRTRQAQLDHILFPIGHLTKDQVRDEARSRNLFTAQKPDSQGICFIGDINVGEFLRERLGEKPGNVLDVDGNVVGQHKGVWFYTIGQRHGFELLKTVRTKHEEWKHVIPPLYVVSKNAEDNTITVGYGAETVSPTIALNDVFWREGAWENNKLGPQLTGIEPIALQARVRHGGKLLSAQFVWKNQEKGMAEILLDEPQRGLAPGQSVIFYDNEDNRVCWGGGVIR